MQGTRAQHKSRAQSVRLAPGIKQQCLSLNLYHDALGSLKQLGLVHGLCVKQQGFLQMPYRLLFFLLLHLNLVTVLPVREAQHGGAYQPKSCAFNCGCQRFSQEVCRPKDGG